MVKYAAVPSIDATARAPSACSTYDRGHADSRCAWEVPAWATALPKGLESVRTVTITPDTCYAPGELRVAPSTLKQTIELQANVARAANGPCSSYMTDIVHDLPTMRLAPDDDQIGVVVFADGAERNLLIVNVENLEPSAGNYTPGCDSRDPRYDNRRY
ncbi:MAG: hypothetical protein ABL956_06450 [Hyphomonadaceae bacterium]